MRKLIKSFKWAMNGLRLVWHEEMNFRIEVAIATAVILFGLYLGFFLFEWVIIIACISAVFAAEILNTAIEDLCNKIEPKTDPAIGKVKDIMASFVLVTCIGSTVIGSIIFLSYLY